jgi:hypothetical protein
LLFLCSTVLLLGGGCSSVNDAIHIDTVESPAATS